MENVVQAQETLIHYEELMLAANILAHRWTALRFPEKIPTRIQLDCAAIYFKLAECNGLFWSSDMRVRLPLTYLFKSEEELSKEI